MDTIVVAIDFGTTYSGMAWCNMSSGRTDRVATITEWPGNDANPTVDFCQAPTLLRYASEVEWGFKLSPEATAADTHRYFKLALDSSHVPDKELGILRPDPNLVEHSADKLVADYLAGFGEWIMAKLREAISLEGKTIRFVLTVPAIWGCLAKARTVQAFRRVPCLAQWGDCTTFNEPEAAAASVLQEEELSSRLSADDAFMVVDAGGGTVDLITYTIVRRHPCLEVREAVPGSGGACGSAFLDHRFGIWLQAKVGRLDSYSADFLNRAKEAFETKIKPTFNMAMIAENHRYSVPALGFADDASVGIRRGRLTVHASDVHMIFEPTILSIIQLVRAQLAENTGPVSAMVLVGGFGRSDYLRERLEAEFGRTADGRSIAVMQSREAWTAVMRGAVILGLSRDRPQKEVLVQIRDRRARFHYGTELCSAYNEAVHAGLAASKFWNGFHGRFDVALMSWFIRRGDSVHEDRPYLKSFSQCQLVSLGRPRPIALLIFAEKTSAEAPMANTGDVTLLCQATANLDGIPEEDFRRRTGKDGREYYYLEGEIEAVYRSAMAAYTLIYNGQRYDTVTAEYVC